MLLLSRFRHWSCTCNDQGSLCAIDEPGTTLQGSRRRGMNLSIISIMGKEYTWLIVLVRLLANWCGSTGPWQQCWWSWGGGVMSWELQYDQSKIQTWNISTRGLSPCPCLMCSGTAKKKRVSAFGQEWQLLPSYSQMQNTTPIVADCSFYLDKLGEHPPSPVSLVHILCLWGKDPQLGGGG